MLYKNQLTIALVLVLICVGAKMWNDHYINSIHSHININDIETIKISGIAVENQYKLATKDEIKNIVNWFNSTSHIHSNPDFKGTTGDSSIIITLKSKKEIAIIRSGEDFEIQRYNKKGKWISYWGEQGEIKRVLEDSAKINNE